MEDRAQGGWVERLRQKQLYFTRILSFTRAQYMQDG